MSARSASARRARPARPPEPELFPRSQVPCGLCGLCCTYVTVEIDPPDTVPRASLIVWYLYHDKVSVYWDRERDWFVQFDTRCRFLSEDRRCEVYAKRPHICRDLDPTSCEINASDEGLQFYEPATFLDWLAHKRPRLHQRLKEAGFVPAEAMLRRPVRARQPLAPFAGRFRALRDLGAVKIDAKAASVPESTSKPAGAARSRRGSASRTASSTKRSRLVTR